MVVRGKAAHAALFSERLPVPWPVWLCWAVLTASLALALLVAFGPGWALGVAGALGAAGLLVLARWTGRVEVASGELRAGRARIPLVLLGRSVALGPADAARLRGPDIDPAAYHYLRGWVATAVVVEVVDQRDPTPYWYLSTRRPEELAAALTGGRASGQAHSAQIS